MKNFSVKTADFDSLSISGESPIVQSDLGTAPNQIPLNKDLGSLAYQDAVNLDDVSADMLELRAIAAEISDSAVDVFVYDTSRDSDGGAWRKRTQHTSWYNEELNTATRGARREFPAVAVIVAEADKVTIYDGDDPDLGMWMVFDSDDSVDTHLLRQGISSVYVKNGTFSVGHNGTANNNRLTVFNFIKETSRAYYGVSVQDFSLNFSKRNQGTVGGLYKGIAGVDDIVNRFVNDVAMTILPNAPIDENTGLPVPTIAVATDGGVSVIKDDGTVVDITQSHGGTTSVDALTIDPVTNAIYFTTDYAASGTAYKINAVPIPLSDRAENGPVYNGFQDHFFQIQSGGNPTIPQLILRGRTMDEALDIEALLATGEGELAVAEGAGLDRIIEDRSGLDNSMIAHTTSKYNTGWMPGDTKLAALSDTKNETVGVDETTELVTNSGFDNGTNGWSIGGAGASYEVNPSEQLVVTRNGTSATVSQTIPTVVGKTYILSCDLISVTGGASLILDLGSNSSAKSNEIRVHSVTHVATSTSTTIEINVLDTSTGTVTVDNISVKQTGELITNGTFDNGTTGWLYADNGTSSQGVSGGVLTLSHTTYTNSMLYQILDLIPGKKYVLTGQTGGTNFDLCNIRIGSSLGGNQFGGIVSSEAASSDLIDHAITFTPTQSTTYISLRVNSSSPDLSCDFDNISIRLAEDDRSVNDNGLQIFGEITKSPVAPGADLVAYSGFSANNYLMQPYNSDLNGLNSFSIMGWVKRNETITTEQPFVSFKDASDDDGVYSSGDTFMLFGTTPNHQLFFQTYEQSTSVDAAQTVWSLETLAEGAWTNFCLVYDGSTSTTKIFMNGRMVNSATKSTGPVYVSDSVMTIGSRFKPTIADHACDQVDLSIIRVSATIPTDDQIAKIYRDEKVLFQDGAQATLYGTSDAVTALAYDDKTELLHVGTSGGRSDFAGLRRINNTTTAVTTSISASNNLIAEQ